MNESTNQDVGLDLWDHREPLKVFKQRGSMLEFHFRWITPNVGAVNGFKKGHE